MGTGRGEQPSQRLPLEKQLGAPVSKCADAERFGKYVTSGFAQVPIQLGQGHDHAVQFAQPRLGRCGCIRPSK